ncbi:MAG TPA: hypothetical protein VHG91_14150 [Longimicrobium sp.]|nr:hypothetical protein [Longimicrobium sp.]
MTAPGNRASLDAIRDAARLAVEATSLRAVARAVGMSPMGLRHFLDGRRPYSATFRKLTAWYVTHAAARHEHSEGSARAALALLLDGVPEGRREAAAAELLETLERLHRESGLGPPGWLARLRGGGE